MPVLTGATLLSPNYSYGSRATSDIDVLDTRWNPAQSLVGSAPAGSLSRVMATAAPRALAGYKCTSYLDDFYYRIHVVPASIDVGFLLGEDVRNVTVWNAHFTVKTYSAFSATGSEGIGVTPPVSPPYNFSALQEQVFLFNVTVEGPPQISAVYTWVIGGETVQLRIVGERTVPFSFEPDWADAVTETLAWRTDVIEARDGSEQRIALRSKPRRSFEYRFQAVGRDWFRLQNTLWGWHRYSFALPLWTDKSNLTADAGEGALALFLDTTSRGFTAGGQAIVTAGPGDYEVVAISAVTSSTVSLVRPLRRAWAALTTVYPVAIGHLPGNVPVAKLTDNVAQGALTMNLDPVRTDPRLPTAAAAVTHNGYEVVLQEPNWVGELDNSSEQDFGILDNDIGPRSYQVTQTFARTVRGYRWLLGSRTEIDTFRALLKRLNGRQKAVYIPTFAADMVLLENLLSGGTSMRVDSPKLASFIGVKRAYQRVMIEMTNGTRYYHSIINVSEDLDGSQIVGLSPSAATLIVPANVRRICFMPLFRLDSDEVVLTWQTDSVATVEASFRLVTE